MFRNAPMLARIIDIGTIVVAGLLITTILLQQRGSGLGMSFGGEGNVYRSVRGAERVIFVATIVLAILFGAGAFVSFSLATQ